VKPAAATEKAGDDSETDETGTTEAAASGRSGKRIAALAAAAVLVIGLVAAAVVSVFAVQSTQQRDERRAEYVATARQTVLNLTTIRADTAKEDIDRILTMASGEFKTEFDGRVDPFTEIVKQAKVVSTGEVVEAAVERDDENSAVILVAAKQTLTNAGSQEQQQRFYRFRVTVQRADDGTLTASDVKFVA
jgi:Mce-associated membrane protein